MPVKNVKRKTNDGFEGVITGLNDKEKEIISNSVGIEANPADEATGTLNKLKIGDGIYSVDYGPKLIELSEITSDFSTTTQEAYNLLLNGINSGKIIGIHAETEGTFLFRGFINFDLVFSEIIGDNQEFVLLIKENLTIETFTYTSFVPPLPDDSSSKTYTLRSVNGILTWVDTSVGTQYFEDINVGGVSLDDKISSAINSAITSTLEANY